MSKRNILQILSNEEASLAFLSTDELAQGGLSPSISSTIFSSAFSSIWYNCSDHWDRSGYWTSDPKTKKKKETDRDFCNAQASSRRTTPYCRHLRSPYLLRNQFITPYFLIPNSHIINCPIGSIIGLFMIYGYQARLHIK